MYYDLEFFGRSIRKMRKTLGYTQKKLSCISTLNMETIRKIENGKVIPNQISLELLSVALKKDLNLFLLKCRIVEHKKYYEIKDEIEYKLENGNYIDLENDVENINNLIKNNTLNNYESSLIKQLSLLVKSIMLKVNNQDYVRSLNTLVKAMQLTTPLFSLDNYNEFVYSNIELRILMNIALLTNILESTDKCINILHFCLKSLNPKETDLIVRTYYNLAYSYHRKDLHDKALFYANEGIRVCIENNSLSCLALLYSRKFIAEYFLKDKNYKSSLQSAINIHDITNQSNLKDMLIKFCKKHEIRID